MKIRMHKGGIAESMATLKEIPATLDAVVKMIRDSDLGYTDDVTEDRVGVALYKADPDDRIGWKHTYLVTVDDRPWGFTDGPLSPFPACAVWSNDCSGKKDYDGHLLSIDCRYWPGPEGGAAMTTKVVDGAVKIGSLPYGPRPSAVAGISLNFGKPDEPDGYDDYKTWREEKFEADTEAKVKLLVEIWVQERVDEIALLLGITP